MKENRVFKNDKKAVYILYFKKSAPNLVRFDQNQRDYLLEKSEKMLNFMIASYESLSKIKLYLHEFVKTLKKIGNIYIYMENKCIFNLLEYNLI